MSDVLVMTVGKANADDQPAATAAGAADHDPEVMQRLKEQTLYKFNAGSFPKAINTVSPDKTLLQRFYSVPLSSFTSAVYGPKTKQSVTLELDTEALAGIREVEASLKMAAMRLGKINNKKITRDVLDAHFKSRLFNNQFTVTCGELLTTIKTASGKYIEFKAFEKAMTSGSPVLETSRVAVQPTYLWSRMPIQIGVAWELKVVVVDTWPPPPSSSSSSPSQKNEHEDESIETLPSMPELLTALE